MIVTAAVHSLSKMASANHQSQSSNNSSIMTRTRGIASLSRFFGTRKAAMKWKRSSLLSEYFTKKITNDPGTFDVYRNDSPAVRNAIEKSRKMLSFEDEHLEEMSFMNKPQNSYNLSPVKPFKVSEVREIMKNTIQEINDEKNKRETDRDLCKSLADEIKLRVKNSGFARYKIVCIVSLLRGCDRQNIIISSRCLWNTDYDNFVQEIFKSKHFTVVATVYALYYD
jgi:hypothetical protein